MLASKELAATVGTLALFVGIVEWRVQTAEAQAGEVEARIIRQTAERSEWFKDRHEMLSKQVDGIEESASENHRLLIEILQELRVRYVRRAATPPSENGGGD
tara:strand:- start:69 stop:374 length:306 start_codon:yes stop_codon:yes gene_type:complete